MAQTNDRGLLGSIRNVLQPKNLLPSLMMGTITGMVEVIYALSLASLIFSGDLASYKSYGLGISLTTSVVILIGTSLFSSVSGVFSSTQDTPAVMLSVIVASLAGTMASSTGVDKLNTILITIFTATVLTGLLFFALGYFGLGKLVRFIPYPVMGGFVAVDRRQKNCKILA